MFVVLFARIDNFKRILSNGRQSSPEQVQKAIQVRAGLEFKGFQTHHFLTTLYAHLLWTQEGADAQFSLFTLKLFEIILHLF